MQIEDRHHSHRFSAQLSDYTPDSALSTEGLDETTHKLPEDIPGMSTRPRSS